MSAGEGLASGLITHGGAPRLKIETAEHALGRPLPADLAEFVQHADAAEGFVANAYLAIWPIEKLAELNRVARVAEFAPGIVIFATNGAGEGYGFDTAGTIFSVPMIGMRIAKPQPMAPSLAKFLASLATTNPIGGLAPAIDTSRVGMVVHELTPIVVGGSPTDSANKILIPLEKYVELVAWWNVRIPTHGATTGQPIP